MDFAGPFNGAVLVVAKSKWMEALPMSSTSACRFYNYSSVSEWFVILGPLTQKKYILLLLLNTIFFCRFLDVVDWHNKPQWFDQPQLARVYFARLIYKMQINKRE